MTRYVGVDLHRRRSVIVVLDGDGTELWTTRIDNDPLSLGLEIEEGTLYPLLRRLEKQGLLQSEWNVEGSRPRRYYELSPAGQEVLTTLSAEWFALIDVMDNLLEENDAGE